METGWIKLYRKILDNDGLFRSAHTFTIWCWLLLNADKKTGEVKVGRHMLARWLKIKPSTVYLTLQRLQNMTMVNLKPNNKMTTVVILNWHTYQDKPDNKMRETKQQDNTIQEYKKKNKEDKNIIYTSLNFLLNIPEELKEELSKRYICSNSQVISKAEDLYNYCKSTGKTYKDYAALLRTAIRKDFGVRNIIPNGLDINTQKQNQYEEELKEFAKMNEEKRRKEEYDLKSKNNRQPV